MLTTQSRFWFQAVTAGALVIASSGCATKKFVVAKVTPVEQRVSTVEKTSSEHGTAIEELEKDQSRTREQVLDLENNLKQTAEKAQQAGSRADQAAGAAQQAQVSATDARKYAENRTGVLERYIDARDQMKLAKASTVLFRLAKSDVDKEAASVLDGIAQDAKSMKRFIFEVQGYADSTGTDSLNLELSQKRAENVVRYLTLTHNIPLRSIHLIGSGSAAPIAPNTTAQGRKQNRRVEVRLFAPEVDHSSAITSAQLR